MSLNMTKAEREAFLTAVHVGVISIEQADAPPLSVPIWYDYRKEVGLWVLTGEKSAKGRALQAAGRFSLCAQDETPSNYRYVSVEGPVTEVRPETRVLYMSGYVDDMMVHQQVVQNYGVFLQKPFTAQMLARRVRETLDKDPTGD